MLLYADTFNHPWLSPHANFSIPLHAQSDLQYAAGTLPGNGLPFGQRHFMFSF
jgi:hypothetical protein